MKRKWGWVIIAFVSLLCITACNEDKVYDNPLIDTSWISNDKNIVLDFTGESTGKYYNLEDECYGYLFTYNFISDDTFQIRIDFSGRIVETILRYTGDQILGINGMVLTPAPKPQPMSQVCLE